MVGKVQKGFREGSEKVQKRVQGSKKFRVGSEWFMGQARFGEDIVFAYVHKGQFNAGLAPTNLLNFPEPSEP